MESGCFAETSKAPWLGDGSELPLPLWERVGVRGHGLSIERNPSPGSHLTMRHSRSLASAFFTRTAAAGGLCLSHKGRGGTEGVKSEGSKPASSYASRWRPGNI